MTVSSAFKLPTIIAGFEFIAVVSEAIEQRGRHFGVADDARPFAEGELVVTMIELRS